MPKSSIKTAKKTKTLKRKVGSDSTVEPVESIPDDGLDQCSCCGLRTDSIMQGRDGYVCETCLENEEIEDLENEEIEKRW